MKTTTLIYCGHDGDAGKALASKLRTDGARAMLRDAATFNRDLEPCECVVIMPDVSNFHADRLRAAYVGKVLALGGIAKPIVTGLIGETPSEQFIVPKVTPLTVKHRGRGRFYVMRGAEIVSGPHTKDEAQRLAA